MILLIDIGNTRVKWACMKSGRMGDSESFVRNKTGIKASINKAWKDLTNVKAIYVANVAGEKIAQQLSEWSEKQWELTPVFVQSEQKRFGVTNAYESPEKLGVDRWLALIAVRQHARQATCVIDCGTAITIDIVTKAGQHQGGLILPGLNLMRTALTSNTDALNEQSDNKEFKVLATNTYSAIQAGTLYSVTATLERIIDDLKQSFNNRIRFIVTGGDAETLLPLLNDNVAHYPDIVLKGLAYYARQNNKKPRDSRTDNKPEIQDTELKAENSPQPAAPLPESAI